jgi:GTP pyrophosphokinase
MELTHILKFVEEKHKGQTRFDGSPYVEHPKRVAEILKKKGCKKNIQALGLMHDLLEDTDATMHEVYFFLDYSPSLLADLVALTKEERMDMVEYIHVIRKSHRSIDVKLADRIDNLNTAMDGSREFVKKYIAETYEYYVPLSKHTVFEKDLEMALYELKVKYIEKWGVT